MLKILLFCIALEAIVGCQKKANVVLTESEITVTDFLNAIYDRNYREATFKIDIEAVKGKGEAQIDSAVRKLAKNINEYFPGGIHTSIVAEYKSIFYDRPVSFLMVNVTSKDWFGFYYFFVDVKTKKILKVSEFPVLLKTRNDNIIRVD